MYLSNYMEEKIQNLMRGIGTTAPAKVYLALFITPTDDASSGTEITYPGYMRKEVTFSVPAPESGGIGIKNDNEVKFAQAPNDAGTVTHIGIYDSLTGGNRLLHGKLNEDKKINTGVAPTVRIGEMVYWSTGNMSTAFKTRWLNIVRGISTDGFTPYITLFNGNPESGGAELSGGNFERIQVSFSAPEESSSGNMMVQSLSEVSYPVATVALGSYNYDVIFDAKTGGDAVWYKESASENYGKGDAVIYDAGEIRIGVN